MSLAAHEGSRRYFKERWGTRVEQEVGMADYIPMSLGPDDYGNLGNPDIMMLPVSIARPTSTKSEGVDIILTK